MTRGRKPDSIVPGSSPVTIGNPPSYLGIEARREWRRVTPILNERRVMTEADIGTLESYCIAVSTFRDCHRLINRDGIVIDGKRNAACGIMDAAQKTARLLANELGLTPVSRSRPAIRDTDQNENDPFDIS